ncbi:MAG TPA: trypco2 family protein [Opitutaceae bacterium]|nr:trypco2 family protein [Opitutaceae bacterium]
MSVTNDGKDRLELSTLVEHVRGEIRRMIDQRDGKLPKLEIQEVQLEVNFVVERQETMSGQAGGDIAVLALTANAEKSHRTENVHKIAITLKVLEPAAPAARPASAAEGPATSGGGGPATLPITPLPGSPRSPFRNAWLVPLGREKSPIYCPWAELNKEADLPWANDQDVVVIPMEQLKLDPTWQPAFNKYFAPRRPLPGG